MKHVLICITGGHATPALAVIDIIKNRHPEWELMWVGRTVALEGRGVSSEEPRLVRDAGVPFYNINAGRFSRSFSFETILSLCKIPVGCIQSFFLLAKERPSLVCSFGGYVALPVATSAFLLGIPVVTHEQTHKPGLANRLIGSIARKIFVSHKETLQYVPKEKAVYTGLPIRPEIFDVPPVPSFPYVKNLPILYFMGGSTGAESLNEIIYQILANLLPRYAVVHQVGTLSYEKAIEIKETLGAYKERYTPVAYLDTRDLAWVYNHLALAIGRSGANTVGELLALRKRAICIPLPWGGDNEQERNARGLVHEGLGMILPQNDATPDTLIHAIEDMMGKTVGRVSQRRMGQEAGGLIVDELEQLL